MREYLLLSETSIKTLAQQTNQIKQNQLDFRLSYVCTVVGDIRVACTDAGVRSPHRPSVIRGNSNTAARMTSREPCGHGNSASTWSINDLGFEHPGGRCAERGAT